MIIRNEATGIGIDVETRYEGSFMENNLQKYLFSYHITITNNSSKTIQICSRYWDIYDALRAREVVEGEGIVGEQPILQPGDIYKYNSGCVLDSYFGMMKGYYNVLSVHDDIMFKVRIPAFKLAVTNALN